MEDIQKRALDKIVDSMNRTKKAKVDWLYEDQGVVQKWMDEQKKEQWNSKAQGKAGWKKIASVPVEVDKIFTKMYGEDYYKNPDFFEKIAPEWKLVKDSKNR